MTSVEETRAALLAWCDRRDARTKKIREMAAVPATRDVSPQCQELYNIAMAASAASGAAFTEWEALLAIDQAAWFSYWDCESP